MSINIIEQLVCFLFFVIEGSVDLKKWEVCREFVEEEEARRLDPTGPSPPVPYTPRRASDCRNRTLLKRMDFSAGKANSC